MVSSLIIILSLIFVALINPFVTATHTPSAEPPLDLKLHESYAGKVEIVRHTKPNLAIAYQTKHPKAPSILIKIPAHQKGQLEFKNQTVSISNLPYFKTDYFKPIYPTYL